MTETLYEIKIIKDRFLSRQGLKLFSLTEKKIVRNNSNSITIEDGNSTMSIDRYYIISTEEDLNRVKRSSLAEVFYTQSILMAESILKSKWAIMESSLNYPSDEFRKSVKYLKSKNYEKTRDKLFASMEDHLSYYKEQLENGHSSVIGCYASLIYNPFSSPKLNLVINSRRNNPVREWPTLQSIALNNLEFDENDNGRITLSFRIKADNTEIEDNLREWKNIFNLFMQRVHKNIESYYFLDDVLRKDFDYKYVEESYIE